MSDFSSQKKSSVAVYPVHMLESTGEVATYEPIMDAKTLRRRFLKNLPAAINNYTDTELKDYIQVAINDAELELGMPIISRVYEDRLPFDKSLYKAFVHLQTRVRPLASVLDLSITSADLEKVFKLPPNWIDNGQFHRGQVNVVPYLAAYSTNIVTGYTASVGAMFLASIESLRWLPGYWNLTYKAGMSCEDGTVPVIANQLIGTIAALEALSNLGPLNMFNSTSLGQDGISQSTSSMGPAIYRQRIEELQTKRDRLIKKMKGKFGNTYRMISF